MFLRFGQLDLRRPDLDSIPIRSRESRVGRSLWGIPGIGGGHGVGALKISFDGVHGLLLPVCGLPVVVSFPIYRNERDSQ